MTRPRWITAAAGAAVIAAACAVVAGRLTTASGARATAVQLDAGERHALAAAGPLVRALPAAFAQVPRAASDLTRGAAPVESARATIHRLPALRPLAGAAGGSAEVALVVRTYDAVLGGRSVDAAGLATAVADVTAAEGQVVPAVCVIAADAGMHPGAAAALVALEADRRAPALAAVVANWSQLYGVLMTVEQAAGG